MDALRDINFLMLLFVLLSGMVFKTEIFAFCPVPSETKDISISLKISWPLLFEVVSKMNRVLGM